MPDQRLEHIKKANYQDVVMDKKNLEDCPKIPPPIQTDWDVAERKSVLNPFKNTLNGKCVIEKKKVIILQIK